MTTEDSLKKELEYLYVPDLGDLVSEIEPDSIVSRTFFAEDRLKGILFGFAVGQELSEHTASRPAVLHFLTGEAQLVLGDDTLEARPGTWVHMPAHLPHSVLAQTEVTMLLLLLR